jgi:hypothetical protein
VTLDGTRQDIGELRQISSFAPLGDCFQKLALRCGEGIDKISVVIAFTFVGGQPRSVQSSHLERVK